MQYAWSTDRYMLLFPYLEDRENHDNKAVEAVIKHFA